MVCLSCTFWVTQIFTFPWPQPLLPKVCFSRLGWLLHHLPAGCTSRRTQLPNKWNKWTLIGRKWSLFRAYNLQSNTNLISQSSIISCWGLDLSTPKKGLMKTCSPSQLSQIAGTSLSPKNSRSPPRCLLLFRCFFACELWWSLVSQHKKLGMEVTKRRKTRQNIKQTSNNM